MIARTGLGELSVRSAVAMALMSAASMYAYAEPAPEPAPAADGGGIADAVGEVTVTGSRITVRDGYTAPTPLTVVGAEQVQQQAAPNLIDFLTTLPAFSGNYTPQGSTQNVSSGTAGTSSVNLRSLGTSRTLVLVNGQRTVGSTVTGLVDVNAIPQQLIERVEVVTGGASAAYGSDAVSGVVNFILDNKFTGFKSEFQSGITTYGDNPNARLSMTGGVPFADGRGHFVVSGQFSKQEGILEGDRDWNQLGWQIVNNPGYTTTNGQPQRLLLSQIAASNATPGGIVVSGPLKGTAFGVGGKPYTYTYGALNSSAFTQGGDWETSSLHLVGQSIEPKLTGKNVFGRLSFDVADNTEVYLQSTWYSNEDQSHAYPNEFFGGLTVKATNAFLPAETKAAIASYNAAHPTAPITTLTIGTSNADMGTVTIDTERKLTRNVLGANGKFAAFATNWAWDAYFQGGVSKGYESAYNSLNLVRHAEAIDAVIGPNGTIVCNSSIANPGNGCIPYNPFGIGVNSQAALNYVLGNEPYREQTFRQNVTAASINGNPFNSWAGPISVATGIEHRTESVRGESTALDMQGVYFAGNYKPTFGSYHVTEEFVETVVPLAADLPFAKALDLNAAARFTDYSTSGSVTTWKLGATYRPIDDVMFRVTRSRDIRAPNLSELFNAGSKVNNVVVDTATGATVAYEGTTTGNPDLDPEKANTTGIGVVYQPSFAQGLSMSVDYWNIDLKDAISTITAQNIVDLCFQGHSDMCAAINGGQPLRQTSGVDRNAIAIQPFNLAQLLVRGIDLETSYRTPLSRIADAWAGDIVFRAFGTHYIKNYTNNTLTLPTDTAGQNTTNGPASWRWNASVTYNLSPFSGTFSARGVSAGTYGNNLIECTSGCPTSTIDHPTINVNHIAGAVYFDVAAAYTMGDESSATTQLFLNVKNLTNKDPVIVAGGPSGLPYDTVTTNASNYDSLGRTFLAGVRIKL